jgi:UDP-2,4-diacetamido-2,4,6-trideoxy-beta-L-altropyranose hydrolase
VKYLFRADASTKQGTGHVMRCLTLAAELIRRGHQVGLLTAEVEIDWLRVAILESGVTVYECEIDRLPLNEIRKIGPDWLIVDSYEIPAETISHVARHVAVLAIVDGDARGIEASLYLDQTIGADNSQSLLPGNVLAGSRYALVRRQVIDAARSRPWELHQSTPNVLCFMGGTDATQTVVRVAAAVASLARPLTLTVVAAESQHGAIESVVHDPARLRLVLPTPELPRLFADADIVVSAAGTSAWDICTLGIPAVFLAVVDNQLAGLSEIVSRGLALGIDTVRSGHEVLRELEKDLARLLDDDALREQLSRNARSEFDGQGASRVAERLESEHVGALLEW